MQSMQFQYPLPSRAFFLGTSLVSTFFVYLMLDMPQPAPTPGVADVTRPIHRDSSLGNVK